MSVSVEATAAMHRSFQGRYDSAVAALAANLRELADRVERVSKPVAPPHSTCGPKTHAVHRIMHEMTWALANTNVDQLLLIAGEADGFDAEYPTKED